MRKPKPSPIYNIDALKKSHAEQYPAQDTLTMAYNALLGAWKLAETRDRLFTALLHAQDFGMEEEEQAISALIQNMNAKIGKLGLPPTACAIYYQQEMHIMREKAGRLTITAIRQRREEIREEIC